MNRVSVFVARPAKSELSGSGVGDERRYTPFRYPRELQEQQRRAGIVEPAAPAGPPPVPSGVSRAGRAASAALITLGAAAAGVAARRYLGRAIDDGFSTFDDGSSAFGDDGSSAFGDDVSSAFGDGSSAFGGDEVRMVDLAPAPRFHNADPIEFAGYGPAGNYRIHYGGGDAFHLHGDPGFDIADYF